MKNKVSLIVLALFLPVALGVWKWVNVLEARLERRLEQPQPLQLKIAKGASGFVRSTPPLTDAFTLTTNDLSGYRSGYNQEEWQVKQLRFRTSATREWKTLPETSWREDWDFFVLQAESPPGAQQQKKFSLFSYISFISKQPKRELLVGQYRLRVRREEEFHDSMSGIRYVAAGIFDFDFHVNPAPQWKKRVILDAVRKIE